MKPLQRKTFREQYIEDDSTIQTETDKIIAWLTPKYDEGILFIIACSTLLLLLINSEAMAFLFNENDKEAIILIKLFVIAGLALSLIHIFINKKRGEGQNYFMTVSASGMSAIIGILAGYYVLVETVSFLIIFPAWNIINSIIILILLRLGYVPKISEEDKTIRQVLPGLCISVLIILSAEFIFHLYWAITLSIALNYAITFNKFVEKRITLNA